MCFCKVYIAIAIITFVLSVIYAYGSEQNRRAIRKKNGLDENDYVFMILIPLFAAMLWPVTFIYVLGNAFIDVPIAIYKSIINTNTFKLLVVRGGLIKLRITNWCVWFARWVDKYLFKWS